jgi:hypothetical protein
VHVHSYYDVLCLLSNFIIQYKLNIITASTDSESIHSDDSDRSGSSATSPSGSDKEDRDEDPSESDGQGEGEIIEDDDDNQSSSKSDDEDNGQYLTEPEEVVEKEVIGEYKGEGEEEDKRDKEEVDEETEEEVDEETEEDEEEENEAEYNDFQITGNQSDDSDSSMKNENNIDDNFATAAKENVSSQIVSGVATECSSQQQQSVAPLPPASISPQQPAENISMLPSTAGILDQEAEENKNWLRDDGTIIANLGIDVLKHECRQTTKFLMSNKLL